ncbi:peptidoglycan recognition protein family protein [Latilactobacillus curvatus]|uniref:peptidoglycan recognition protein family protein n=1 Tax=Latilactobacillus curvatus TaxID=28038 RepID=UPI0024117AC1|nr:peptidoglycan recognition family protein [Latilactobacillus curvatus]MDG2979069.1 peptidoglycan recognition protein family protein [Latilactobacillus curvatus]
MKKNWIGLTISGMLLLGVSAWVNVNQASAASVMTPDQMKSQLTSKDINEATPIKKEQPENGQKQDDIGMPIENAPAESAISPASIYTNVNSYILQHNYQHPNITSELHQFSMFGYSTDDGRPSGVVVHYTDNPTNFSARNEADYEINGGWQSAFVHTFIDANTILNIHATDFGAWGCGPVGNKYFAQFEMVTARNFDDFTKTTSYSAWYTAYLLSKYNLTPSLAQAHNGVGTVWSHSDVTHYLGGTNHTDPDAYFAKYGYSMGQFFDLVQHYYDEMNADKNVGAFDSSAVQATSFNVKGWHASSKSVNKPYSYLIVLDADTNREIERVRINRTQRPDVNRVYPNVKNSLNSGFDQNLPISSAMYDKRVKIISRYSDSADGNGAFSDYSFGNVITMPKNSAGSLDVTDSSQPGKINLQGWFATNQAQGKPYRYVILLDSSNGKELGRYPVKTLSRPDVANVYSGISNAINSGYSVDIPLNSGLLGKTFRVIARYSDNAQGNGNFTDYWNNRLVTAKSNSNVGWLDTFKQSGNNIQATGWHATDSSIDKPYHFLIILNANGNREVARYALPTVSRPDVANVYKTIYGANRSGIDYKFATTSAMKGKRLRVISRYTNDQQGNGSFVDYWFPNEINQVK